jgi:hypothetical protein
VSTLISIEALPDETNLLWKKPLTDRESPP